MVVRASFDSLFQVRKPIIGMIHLAGSDQEEKVRRALDELKIYEEEGVDGAIIEDYHGDVTDVYETLRRSNSLGLKIVVGVNVLIDPYISLSYADNLGAKFVQFDSVQTPDLDLGRYSRVRERHPGIAVLGGVRFKYTPDTGSPLEQDLIEAALRCEAIVTTGKGTGIETPLEKLREFRRYLDNFPLIVGAGVNRDNVREQLGVADAAIVGSCFKPNGDTRMPVDRGRVRDLMQVVKEIRG